jgi:hypothetical protein
LGVEHTDRISIEVWYNYHGTDYTYAGGVAVAVDGNGDVFVTGSTSNGTNQDYTTIKYSGAGVRVWTNRYVGPEDTYDIAAGLAVDGSGNVFVTGYSYHNDGTEDFATVAYSGSGVALWTNVYDGPVASYDTEIAVAVDTRGNVFVTGNSAGSFATLKYSGAGVAIWTNRFNDLTGNSIDQAAAVIVDGGGSVFVTGSSIGVGSSYDFVTIKYSSAGVPLWTNRYNGPANGSDVPYVMAADSAGNVIVAGYSWNGTSLDYATIKYSSAGVPLRTNSYHGPGNSDAASALALDGSGNLFVTGSSSNGTKPTYATIKYSNAGVPVWTNRYGLPGSAFDQAVAVAVDRVYAAAVRSAAVASSAQ